MPPGRKLMRRLCIGIALAFFLSNAGCSSVSQCELFNNTSSDIQIVFGEQVMVVKSHSKHQLSNQIALDSLQRPFRAIIIRDHQRYGYMYTLDLDEMRRDYGGTRKIHLILNEDGCIYLADSKSKSQVLAAKQPVGLPVRPTRLN